MGGLNGVRATYDRWGFANFREDLSVVGADVPEMWGPMARYGAGIARFTTLSPVDNGRISTVAARGIAGVAVVATTGPQRALGFARFVGGVAVEIAGAALSPRLAAGVDVDLAPESVAMALFARETGAGAGLFERVPYRVGSRSGDFNVLASAKTVGRSDSPAGTWVAFRPAALDEYAAARASWLAKMFAHRRAKSGTRR
jgi:hypothetical protein